MLELARSEQDKYKETQKFYLAENWEQPTS